MTANKPKSCLADKGAAKETRRRMTAEAALAMQARANAILVIWRRKQSESLSGSREELEPFYRAWATKASPSDQKWAAKLVARINVGMRGKAS